MLFNALKQQQMASIPRSATGERKAETKTVQAAPVPSQAPEFKPAASPRPAAFAARGAALSRPSEVRQRISRAR